MYKNPFLGDPDRESLWNMLVERDIEAYLNCDFDGVEGDFLAESFFAVDARREIDSSSWKLSFPTLGSYKEAWLKSARQMWGRISLDRLRNETLSATDLSEIEIQGDLALAHKKFNGDFTLDDGHRISLHWRTVYQCRRVDGRWRIAGFIGYLPYTGSANA